MFREKAEKKSIASIVKALEQYDGCEIDVRLTRDRILVLHHDSEDRGQRLVKTDYKDLRDVPALAELIQHPRVIQLVNDKGKTLWIEAKEDSVSRIRKDPILRRAMAMRLTAQLMDSNLRLENIRIISFCAEILNHVKGIQTYVIFPYLFSATDCFFPYYNPLTVFHMLVSLRRHIQKAKKMGFNGLLFSKLYLRGFFSSFQPPLELIRSLKRDDFILGTEAQTYKEEKDFKDFTVFTDYRGSREGDRGDGVGPLICHRGL